MDELKIDDRIRLRLFTEIDAEAVVGLVKKNYARLRPFLHWVTLDYSIETAREFIGQARRALAENSGRTFGIFDGEKLIGVIGFVLFDWSSRRTEIGYWIDEGSEGKGIVARSCKALADYAFRELAMNRIEIRCATENSRSRRIPERMNFKLDGVLRQSEWRHTRFFDMAIYSLLAEEWETSEK